MSEGQRSGRAAVTADDRLERWRAGFEDMFALVASRFAQVESRRRARMYLLGLLSGVERKNSWTIAEAAGDLTSDGMQRLLNFYSWDADAVRDDLRGYVRWQRLSAGAGSKGQRLYDWLLIDPGTHTHHLLVRRSISKPDELAYYIYIVHSTTAVPLVELVRIVGSRWAVEETFSSPKTRSA